MLRKKLFVLPLMVFALVAGLAVSTTQTADAQTLERIVSSGELRVGMSGNQAPYNAVSRTGDMIGLDVDLATMLAGAFGVNLDIVVKPFPQLLPALQAGEVDIVISGMAITNAIGSFRSFTTALINRGSMISR